MNFLSTILSAIVLLSLNSTDGVYESGDTVRVFATENGVKTLVHEKVYTETENVIFKYADTQIGWVVEPKNYGQALPCPKDFDKFWKKEIKRMRSIPMNTQLKEIEVPGADNKNYVCYELTLDCVDNTPVRGYLAMPRNASNLPIVLFMHAAGVSGHWCRSNPKQTMDMAKWGNGAICIDFNAFGMLNDAPESYYKELENGELKGYSSRMANSKEEYFFKNMYLRAVRALDYVCSLEQWDGKRVLAYGQSQGGAQAVAVAGLDKRVSAVVGIVPAGFNSAGSAKAGGHDSWPFIYGKYEDKELAQKIMPYFDGCNFLKRTKAKLWIEIGLMDTTCLPEAIYSGVNVSPSKEIIIKASPYRFHDEPAKRYHDQWKKGIYTERFEWINNYLR